MLPVSIDQHDAMRLGRRTLVAALPMSAVLAGAERVCAAPVPDIVIEPAAIGAAGALNVALERAASLSGRVTIGLRPGVYREKLNIRVPGVTLVGLGKGAVVTYGAAAGLSKPMGGKWGTGGSATLTVEAPQVTLRDITVRNDFDYVDDTAFHSSGGAQAVALSIARDADRTLVERCVIEGYQDTLYVSARSLFRRCTVKGGVDFIFGGAASLFQNCDIVTRFVPRGEGQGYVAAPSTLAAQQFGLVFDRCHVTREPRVPDASTYLGRPWRAGGNMAILGAAAFLRCRLDAHIRPAGWTAMGFTDPGGTRRMLEPGEARLFEWQSSGPGAAPAGPGRRLLTDAEAAAYTSSAILQGWVP